MIILHLCTKSPTDMRYRVWRAETGNFRSFLNFYSPKILKNQNFEKMKKKKKMLIILLMCTKIAIKWCNRL